jgi:hypothetical protein
MVNCIVSAGPSLFRVSPHIDRFPPVSCGCSLEPFGQDAWPEDALRRPQKAALNLKCNTFGALWRLDEEQMPGGIRGVAGELFG